MEITVKELGPPRKGSSLASAIVQISFEEHSITVADLRVLRNRSGELWVALPSFIVHDEGNAIRYESTVTASRALSAEIQNAVLAAFEQKSGGGQ